MCVILGRKLSAGESMLSGLSYASVEVRRCLLYERGQCHRGNSCRYLHDVETTSSVCPDESLTSVPHPQIASTPVKPCRYFLRTGWCSFGSKCRFSHCQKPSPAAETRDGNAESGKSIVGSDQHVPQTAGDRRKSCWFFKHGRCHFGEKCRHRHVTGNVRSAEVKEQSTPSADETSMTETGQHSEIVEPTRHTSTTEKESVDVNVVDRVANPSHVISQRFSEISRSVQSVAETSDKLDMLRSTEITQLRRRYPKAAFTETEDGCTVAKFVFEPSDPDWVMTLC